MKNWLIFSILLCCNAGSSQTIVPYLRSKDYADKVYFVDSATIKPVNKTGYDYDYKYFTTLFTDGLMPVRLNRKYGYINKNGEEVIIPQYEEVLNFHEGLAAVMINKKWGFIDKTGKEIVTPQYDRVYSFKEGLAGVCKDKKWGFIDKTGKEIIALKYASLGYDFYYGEAGSGALPELVCGFCDGRCTVSINDKWGFIDKTGKEVVPLNYRGAYHFDRGVAIVEIADYKTGLINTEGKFIIPAIYGGIFPDSEFFLVTFSSNTYWGCLNRNGKVIVVPKYQSLANLGNKLFGFGLKDKAGIMDITGKILYQTDAQTSIISRYNDIILVSKDGKYGFITASGKSIIPIQYHQVKINSESALIGFKRNEDSKWGFMDKSGKEVESPIYDEIKEFSGGLAAVKQNENWGFINEKGALVIPLKYSKAESFVKGWALVKIKYSNFFIDKMGREYMGNN